MNPNAGYQLSQELKGHGMDVTFSVLDGCGHHIYIDDYQEFNAIVSSFASHKLQQGKSF